MKLLKYSLFFPLLACLPAQAVIYTGDFSGTDNEQTLVTSWPSAGVDGWTQSEANDNNDSPKAFVTHIGTDRGVAVGAYFDDYVGTTFSATRGFAASALPATMSMSVTLFNSTLSYPNRDNFFISLLGTGMTINFTANSSDITTGGSPADITWNVSINNEAAFGAIFSGATYELSLDLLAVGSDLEYDVSLIGTNTFTTDGSIVGGGSVVVNGLELGTSLGNISGDWGDNYMGVTNINIIPEPSSALLIGLSSLIFLRRRR